MATWGEVLREVGAITAAQAKNPPPPGSPSPHDIVRRKYLAELAEFTGRPVIVYASGWLEGRPISDPAQVSVSTRDVMGFMEAVHGLPPGPLDLILHSPGGDPNAAQAIMSYLRAQGFDPIRAIVPISAMSAATMMALSCDELLMGNHSQIGPIDPQFTIQTPDGPRGAPAQAILDQFESAKSECASKPESLAAWLPILRSYGPGLLSQCVAAQAASEDLVAKAMQEHMFSDLGQAEAKAKADAIAKWFNDHNTHRSHGRPVRIQDAQRLGVKVTPLEEADDLQDKVLTAWHGVQLTLSNRPVLKLVENSINKGWVISAQMAQFQIEAQPVRQIPFAGQKPADRAERRRQERAQAKAPKPQQD